MKKPGLKEIANIAGVSTSAVSMALRDHPRIGKATKIKIKKIASQLNYEINPLVHQVLTHLRSGNQGKIHASVALLDLTTKSAQGAKGRIYGRFIEKCKERCLEFGYDLEYFWVADPRNKISHYQTIFKNRNVRGLILCGHGTKLLSVHAPFTVYLKSYPIINFDTFPSSPNIPSVSPYISYNLDVAVKKAIQLGYKRLGLVNSALIHKETTSASFLAFQATLPNKARIPILTSMDQFRTWLSKYQPEVIITYGKEAYNRLKHLKIKVPEKMGVITLDKHEGTNPNLAGVKTSIAQMANIAVEILNSKMTAEQVGVESESNHLTLIHGHWSDGISVKQKQ